MRKLLRGLSARPDPIEKWWQIIGWWEARRIPYNIIVGSAGIISLVFFYVFISASGELKAGEDAVEPLVLVVAPFIINILYTGGWVLEVLIFWMARRDMKVGPVLFAAGTAFSLCVVAFPSVAWGLVWLVNMIRR